MKHLGRLRRTGKHLGRLRRTGKHLGRLRRTGEAAVEPGPAPGWVAVAAAADLPDGTVLAVEAAGTALALFNVDGHLHAVERWCPHRAGDLAEGTIIDSAVACTEHWWRFDLASGECRTAASRPLDVYPVRVDGGRVEVLVSPAS